jgi:hypothetical protein
MPINDEWCQHGFPKHCCETCHSISKLRDWFANNAPESFLRTYPYPDFDECEARYIYADKMIEARGCNS